MNMNSTVENTGIENTMGLGSSPDVEIGEISTRKRRCMVVTMELNDHNDSLMFHESSQDMILWGGYMKLNCPCYRDLYNLGGRMNMGELYKLKLDDRLKWTRGSERVHLVLKEVVPNGEPMYSRDHVHYSVLTARPILWGKLMIEVNKVYPGMYTPADRPNISSYRFSTARSMLTREMLVKRWPCFEQYFVDEDRSKNMWLQKCAACRDETKSVAAHKGQQVRVMYKDVGGHIGKFMSTDIAMKWACMGRRMVCGI